MPRFTMISTSNIHHSHVCGERLINADRPPPPPHSSAPQVVSRIPDPRARYHIKALQTACQREWQVLGGGNLVNWGWGKGGTYLKAKRQAVNLERIERIFFYVIKAEGRKQLDVIYVRKRDNYSTGGQCFWLLHVISYVWTHPGRVLFSVGAIAIGFV